MAALDSNVSPNRDNDRRGEAVVPPPAFTAMDAYGTKPPATDRVAANDHLVNGRLTTDGGSVPSSLSADQQAFLTSWRSREREVLAYNLKNDQDGGAHLQNSIYAYTRDVLKREGLDKAGWEVLPVGMNSPLDKIGADIVLVNNRTGAMAFIDPTSRRLDPKTGEYADRANNAKTNVPTIREAGVVDALPRWFERGSGILDTQQDDPQMREKVEAFRRGYPEQIHNLINDPPFNLKDFPMPWMGPVKDQKVEVEQIQKVVDWANRAAADSRRNGDYGQASVQKEFADALSRGALNYSKRTDSENLHTEVDRQVNRVIAEEAAHRAYPQLFKGPTGENLRSSQRLADGSEIKADKAFNLVVNLRGKPGQGQDQVLTGGSLTDAFRKATNYWAGAPGNKARIDEFVQLLPKNVRREIEAGRVQPEKIIAAIGNDRNVFAGGGAGVDKPLIQRVVGRLANNNGENLRHAITGTAQEVTAPVEGRTASTGLSRPPVGPGSRHEVAGRPEQTSYGRPQAGGDGGWQAGRAPAPVVGKVDRAPVGPSDRARVGGDQAPQSEHLTPAEIKVLEHARQAIESKGQENLTASDREQIASFRFAEAELSKPLGGDRSKIEIVSHIRRLMGSEARGAVMSVAILSATVLGFFESSQAQAKESERAKFN